MGLVRVASAGLASLDIEWRDNNLRVNRAHIVNLEAHGIAITVRDETGELLFEQTYSTGVYQQTIQGAVNRVVTITEIRTGDFEFDLSGLSVGLRNPA